MEILPKELIFRFLIASDMGRRPKYSWQLLLFIINSPNRQKLEKRKTQRGRHAQRHFFRGSIGDYQNVMCRQRPDFQPPSPCVLPQQRNRSTLELHFWGYTWSQSCGDWGIVAGLDSDAPLICYACSFSAVCVRCHVKWVADVLMIALMFLSFTIYICKYFINLHFHVHFATQP